MNSEELAEKMMEIEFDANALSWEDKVTVASYAINSKEVYQKLLGKLAASLPQDKSIKDFAHDLENMTGRRVAAESLRVYRRVYEKLKLVIERIPQDWSYRAWRALATMENPGEWIDRGVVEGLSSAQVVREIRLERGLDDKGPKICPRCQKIQPDPKICLSCGQPL